MTERVIALIDGSDYARSTCDHAAWVAKRSGIGVELLHVIPPAKVKSDLSGAIRLGARSALLAELSELDETRSKLASRHGRAILEDAAEIVRAGGVEDVQQRLRHGDLVETVAEIEPEARLILIGKRGENDGGAQGGLGSNLERVVRAAKRPVLVSSRTFTPVERVLLVWDGGAAAGRALERIATLPFYRGLFVQVTSVGERDGQQAAVVRLREAGVDAKAMRLDDPQDGAMAGEVVAGNFQMVVTGAYRHSPLRHLMVGSTTDALIRDCKVPLLLVR
ncbi:universal stress protein [Paracoccus tegillarcae]|uniref:Universal stress protein UspA n=1 Tax=Paracoccus tegillarcae TaxID=1529068 RepID=A0A2K9EIC5_9RHOB|nr:universal stress protein [Paracoccus tegillarcae]AUH34733.1 universal stress protein UspA [Paracoccus tegillarcae]